MTESKKPRRRVDGAQVEEVIPFKPNKKIVCPFCKKLFYMGNEPDGTPAVLHDTPACKEFLDLDLADFLHKVRMIYSP